MKSTYEMRCLIISLLNKADKCDQTCISFRLRASLLDSNQSRVHGFWKSV
jgi:hypothetical protein